MDVLSVSDKATGDRTDHRRSNLCKNGAIDRRSSLNLQKESSFDSDGMEIYHHHARTGALDYYYYPFTYAQLKELERQTMIYKYVISSIPVPFDLLLSSSASPYDSGQNVRSGLKGGDKDKEPGRCRRTDGKKWRCSRDVVPHHKYCERHLYRGRPRSRKPVETTSSSSSSQLLPYSRRNINGGNSNSGGKKDGSFEPLTASLLSSYRGDPSLHWDTVKGEILRMVTPTEQPPYSPMQSAASMLSRNYDNISCSEQQGNQYLNFIDVWSNGVNVSEELSSSPVSRSSVSANWNLPISSLALSMGGNNLMEDEMGPIQMGLGVTGSRGVVISSEMTNWLAPAATPGGPLAEILNPSPVSTPSVVVAAENPPSPNAGSDGGQRCSRITTPSSSSSIEMKRTTASNSGNSSQS